MRKFDAAACPKFIEKVLHNLLNIPVTVILPKIITDQQALNATSHFAHDHRLLVEPACGATLSLVYKRLIDSSQFPTLLVIVCGGNAITNFH